MNYQIKSIKQSITKKYDLRFAPSGYAIIFLDDATGMISMQTDWGNFSHAWTSNGIVANMNYST